MLYIIFLTKVVEFLCKIKIPFAVLSIWTAKYSTIEWVQYLCNTFARRGSSVLVKRILSHVQDCAKITTEFIRNFNTELQNNVFRHLKICKHRLPDLNSNSASMCRFSPHWGSYRYQCHGLEHMVVFKG